MIREVTAGAGYFPVQNSKTRQSGQSFAELLNGFAGEESAPEIPEKWSDGTGGVFRAVAGFMEENFGIDIYERVPTHEMTDEQKSWLRSRYDLSAMRISVTETIAAGSGTQYYCHHTEEYNNFLGDLVYLNILSPDEAVCMNMVAIPAKTGLFGSDDAFPDYSGEKADFFIEAIKRMIERQRDIISFMEERSKSAASRDPGDLDFIERAREMLDEKMMIFDILAGLV